MAASGKIFCAGKRHRTRTGKLTVSNMLIVTNTGFEWRLPFDLGKLIFMSELCVAGSVFIFFAFFVLSAAGAGNGILRDRPPGARAAIRRVRQASGGWSPAASENGAAFRATLPRLHPLP